jgi:phosphotransferase family enzyme
MVNAALSQVGTLLDVSRMKAILSQRVFAGRRVSACRILHFRYKPGRTWIVSYAISLPGAEDEQIVYLRACERRGSAPRYAKSRALDQDVRHIPDLDSVAWIFPSDRKLTGLHSLFNDANLHANVLPAIAAAAYGPGWIVQSCSREIVHYLPERSCMIRLDVTLRNASDQSREIAAAFYGKAYPDEQGAETFRYLSELWGGEARVARPLLYQPESAVMWQLGVKGAGFDARAPQELEAAASALAALHRSRVTNLPEYPPTVSRLDATAEVIGDAMPDHREAILVLIRRLRAQSVQLAKRPPATLHGDLHLKNFIVTPKGVALIDLDTLAAGDPLEDLASFAAALCSSGLADGVPADETQQRVTAFVKAYERAAGWNVPQFDLNWHIAAALTTERALRAVTRMKADSPSPAVLIDMASGFAERAEEASTRVQVLV